MTTEPRLGCGALIQRSDGRILLARRRRAPEAGHWGILGGKVDFMERVEDAVAREIFEESGLRIRPARLLCLVDHFEPHETPPQHWVAPVYLGLILGAEDARLAEPEALSGMDWFALDALPAPLTKATLQALAALG